MAEHVYTATGTAPGEPSTRRRVLSAFTGAAFTGAAFAGTALVIGIPDAPAAEHPDAELIQVAAEFEALEHEIYPEHGPETMEAEEAWEAAVEPLHARQMALRDRLCELRATTIEGHRARAHVIAMWSPDLVRRTVEETADGYWMPLMMASLLRDLSVEMPA